MKRRHFVASASAGLASVALLRGPAGAAEFTFRCASTFPVQHASSVRMREMWSAVEKESQGRIHTDFYAGGVLGGDSAMIPQVRGGSIQFFLSAIGTLTSVLPLANIFFLGFVFKDDQQGLGVVDGPLGDLVRTQIPPLGMHPCRTVWASGMVEVSSSLRPIQVPDDLRGFKLRVSLGKAAVDLFKDLGASPTPINNNEIYTALQTKIIDGTASPLDVIESGRLYEIQKYISLTNHQCGSFWLLANAATWQSLPPDLQALVERNNTKYGMLERNDMDQLASSLRVKLQQQGLAVNDVDQAPFQARLAPYYQEWAAQFGAGPWGMLETALGHKLG